MAEDARRVGAQQERSGMMRPGQLFNPHQFHNEAAMETEYDRDWHTECFRVFCHVASWVAIVAFFVGIAMCLSSRDNIALARGWTTWVWAIEAWFVCRFAIIVLQIRDRTVGR